MLLLLIYMAFISLGLPDTLLGAGWPEMYGDLGVELGTAGVLTMLCGVGTVFSALCSQHLIARFGTGRVTAFSTGLTAVGLLLFSVSGEFWMLCLCMVPLGIGQGCVDAALNNYVAIHYESRHMSWLHCMWGVGTTVGPYIMGSVLAMGFGWRYGYRSVGLVQLVFAAVLFAALPLWLRKTDGGQAQEEVGTEALSLRETLAIPGVKAAAACFFLYCGVEQTAGLWASSYLHIVRGFSSETAAKLAGLYFFGLTVGRALSGFLTMRFSDRQLIRLGLVLIFAGAVCILLPSHKAAALLGFVLMGLGSAPIYPCMVHSTPAYFGEARSQAVIGVQMTGAFLGSSLLPPLFGLLTRWLDIALLPVQILILLGGLAAAHCMVEHRKT